MKKKAEHEGTMMKIDSTSVSIGNEIEDATEKGRIRAAKVVSKSFNRIKRGVH